MRFLFLILLQLIVCSVEAQNAMPQDSIRPGTVTFRVEHEAQFPGGLVAWQQFLLQNISFDRIMPTVPKTGKRWEQTAVVRFIVEKDGALKDLQVINEVPEAVAREAIRIIALSPKWEPALVSGRKVRAYKKQPITFVVEAQ